MSRELFGDQLGQHPVQLLLAFDGVIFQIFCCALHQGQQLGKGHPQMVERKADSFGVNPRLLSLLRDERREENVAVRRREDQRYAANAPRLQQLLFLIQRLVQLWQSAVFQAAEGGCLPGSGRGVLQPAGSGDGEQLAKRIFLVQMMRAQPVGADLAGGKFHSNTSFTKLFFALVVQKGPHLHKQRDGEDQRNPHRHADEAHLS